jgi:electron transport complex protein RnfG
MIKQVAYTAWVLGLTMAISSALLVITEASFKDRIAAYADIAVTRSAKTLVPETAQTLDKGSYRELLDANGKIIGYAFVCEGRGYQSTLKMLCAVDARLERIIGIEVLEADETPGLGTRVKETWFKKQFAGKSMDAAVAYVKGTPKAAHEIAAISGATVSTRAFVDAVNAEIVRKKAEILR